MTAAVKGHASTITAGMRYRFGPFVADGTTYQVSNAGRTLDLTPKLLDLLFCFLERPASLITKEALLETVWPGANVTDNALAQAISELRLALGDRPSNPQFIKTVARRGYRFVAEVTVDDERPGDAALVETAPPPVAAGATDGAPSRRRRVMVLDFENVTGSADVAWLSAGIAETVANDLAALGSLRVIDRWTVVQTSHREGRTPGELASVLGADLVVTGSFQRSDTALRITARVVDRETGASVAEAKVDGPLSEVFALQDGIAAAFARELGGEAGDSSVKTGRDTTSLEAYRAYTEGWLKIESLDTDLVAASIRDFERAVAADSSYALAHTGLANAAFVAYEMTRTLRAPNTAALRAGVDHARHAIALDPHLAEAHATLSFLLAASAEFDAARAAAATAVSIEPDSWRHQYRLGHASWGQARLNALDRAAALNPRFPYAQFEACMVHVARGDLDTAARLAAQGVADQDRQARSGHRFPAIGFHWLRGALAAAGGRQDEAIEQFDRELSQVDARRLYGPEYGALALIGRGHAEMSLARTEVAVTSFAAARDHVPGHGRAHLGEAVAQTRLGHRAEAEEHWREVEASIEAFGQSGRRHEEAFLAACADACRGDLDRAVAHLDRLLALGPASFYGWTIPLEPFLRPLAADTGFRQVLNTLSQRS